MKKINCNYIDKTDKKFMYDILKKYGEKVYHYAIIYELDKKWQNIENFDNLNKNYLLVLCLDYDEHLESYYLFKINDFEVEQLKIGKYERDDFKYIKEIENEIKSELSTRYGKQYLDDCKKYLSKKNELKKEYENFELEY